MNEDNILEVDQEVDLELVEEIDPAEGEFNPEILTLADEEGIEHQFELIDKLDVGDDSYTALIPYYAADDDLLESDSQLVILKVVTEDGENYLSIIEDEEEFTKISELFVEKLSDMYEIED